MNETISRNRERIYLCLILVLGAILRFVRLGHQSFWWDEVYSANLAAKSLGIVVPRFGQTPTLYHILLHFWLYLGRSDAFIRLLSVVFGVGVLWAIYLLGKSLLSAREGLLAALFLAITPFHIWYSQEARMYSLVILLSAFSMLFYINFLEGCKRWSGFWWALMSVLAIYTHYYAGFMVAGQVIFFFLFWSRYRSRRAGITWSIVAIIMLGLPIIYLLFFKGRYTTVCAEGAGGNPFQIFSIPYTFFVFSLGFSYGPSVAELHWTPSLATVQLYLAEILPVFLLFSALFVLGIRSLWWKKDRCVLLLTYLLIPMMGAGIISMALPKISFNVRYVAIAIPAYALILCHGLLAVRKKSIRWILLVLMFVFIGISILNYYSVGKYAKEDYRSAAGFISAYSDVNDVILTSQVGTFHYYYDGPTKVESLFWSPKYYRRMIHWSVRGHNRAWLVLSRQWGADPEGRMKDYMKSTFPALVETTFSNLYLGLFEIRMNQRDEDSLFQGGGKW